MNFNHQELSRPLEWNETEHIRELVVEAPVLFRSIIKDLSSDSEEKSLSFTDQKGNILTLSKEVDFIPNPLHLDFTNRRATTTLIKLLAKTSVSEDFYESTNKLKTKIIKYINELIDSENFVFEVSVDDFSMDDIAKAVSVHVVDDEDDFVELLTDYMTMMVELAGIKVFVFLNLRMCLNKDELERLIKNANNHELDILLFEGKDFGKITGVERLVIDQDLCEI